MSGAFTNINNQKLVDRLNASNDFDFLFKHDFKNLAVFDHGVFGRPVDIFGDVDFFVNEFNKTAIFFPESITKGDYVATDTDLDSCKNYIIDLLFMAVVIDEMLTRYKSTNKDIAGFFVKDNINNAFNSGGIVFEMVIFTKNNKIVRVKLRVDIPFFLNTSYEEFDTIKEFRLRGYIKVYLNADGGMYLPPIKIDLGQGLNNLPANLHYALNKFRLRYDL